MGKGVIVAYSNPVSKEAEAEYNEWYNGVHAVEFASPEGCTLLTRYKISGTQFPGAELPPYQYLAIYEIENVERDFPQMMAAVKTPSRAIDPKSSLVLFDEIHTYKK